jgi:hypothetical protein
MKIYDYTILKADTINGLIKKVTEYIHEQNWEPFSGVSTSPSGLYLQVMVKVIREE